MLDPKWLRAEPEKLIALLGRKNFTLNLEQINSLDARRKVLQQETEKLQNDKC